VTLHTTPLHGHSLFVTAAFSRHARRIDSAIEMWKKRFARYATSYCCLRRRLSPPPLASALRHFTPSRPTPFLHILILHDAANTLLFIADGAIIYLPKAFTTLPFISIMNSHYCVTMKIRLHLLPPPDSYHAAQLTLHSVFKILQDTID